MLSYLKTGNFTQLSITDTKILQILISIVSIILPKKGLADTKTNKSPGRASLGPVAGCVT
jgi:hypothetical protein